MASSGQIPPLGEPSHTSPRPLYLQDDSSFFNFLEDNSAEEAAVHAIIKEKEQEIEDLRTMVNRLAFEVDDIHQANDAASIPAALIELEEARHKASEQGDLSAITAKISASTGEMLLSKLRGEDQKRRVYSPEEVAFFGLILCAGGMAVLAFISAAVGGPHAETVQKWRQESGRMMVGTSIKAIRYNMKEFVMPQLLSYNLNKCK